MPPELLLAELPDHARARTGDLPFDALYALAQLEATQDSVDRISDGAYGGSVPIRIDAFQTGELWKYVWTRDLSYSADLGMAQFDPQRAVDSLLFKTSTLKPGVVGGDREQIIQDTGSGGSYPVSSDRVVWALGAKQALNFLSGEKRDAFLHRAFPILCETIEQDRGLVFDERSGLYRGEESFLDWREQTYPGWTKADVLPIAMSKSLSVNALDYNLLQTAAEFALECGRTELADKYQTWAAALKDRINQQFYDPQAGLYSSYLLSDGIYDTRVDRYDLLGECLTVLLGIADHDRAASVLTHYPTGPFGPPVVWPEERSVPIYHNQAVWPFVTAYWTRAARQVHDAAAVDAGVQSLEDGASRNLSNIENFDLLTGISNGTDGPRTGPVVDSRRQLWSVAGYLSMVQNVIFGEEVSTNGIRFDPCITMKMREQFPDDLIELRNLSYRDTRHKIRVHLPHPCDASAGICDIDHVELNGAARKDGFLRRADLKADNTWDIYLKPPSVNDNNSVRQLDAADERSLFAPSAPLWAAEHALEQANGHMVLTYVQNGTPADVMFRIYRDGQLYAGSIAGSPWKDPQPAEQDSVVHAYAVAAVDARTGTVSHLTPNRYVESTNPAVRVSANELTSRGGSLVNVNHFENWGAPADELSSKPLQVNQGGRYAVRVLFSNGSGPVDTGICCGVKRAEIDRADTGRIVTGGYIVMPQSGDWTRWDQSSPLLAELRSDQKYVIRVFEDGHCRNMSYLAGNERYTGGSGGGPQTCNFVNVAGIDLQWLGPAEVQEGAPPSPLPRMQRVAVGNP